MERDGIGRRFDGVRPKYPQELLGPDDDDGTMPMNVSVLREAVVGHRIAKAEQQKEGFVITLDNGKEVRLANSGDCCAYTELEAFFLHPERIDHMIMGVGTTESYTRWHIYADWGDILELTVGWSCGNPFYYGYGFSIDVTEDYGN